MCCQSESANCDRSSFGGYFILFLSLIIISLCGLVCVVYFLYLKRLEIHSKLCGCRILQMNLSTNQTEESEKSSDNKDPEISTWDVYKYLEFLKKKNKEDYEEPKFCQEQVYDNLLMQGASTSRESIHSKHITAFMIDEIKKKKVSK